MAGAFKWLIFPPEGGSFSVLADRFDPENRTLCIYLNLGLIIVAYVPENCLVIREDSRTI